MTKTNQKIPERWSVTRLELLGEFSKGSGITKNDLMQNGLPCVRYAELYTKFDFIIPCCISFISEETAKTAKPIRIGDILFAGSGETKEEIGKCAVYMNPLIAYAGGDNIIFRTTNVVPLYLSFYLNTLGRKQLNKLGQGDSIVHIHSNDLKNVIVPLPPLAEQEKIAEILGCWDDGIEKLSRLIEQKKLLKKGLMQRLLSGKQRLSGFSEPWSIKKLGEMGKFVSGGTPDTEKSKYWDGNIIWLTPSEITKLSTRFVSESERKITDLGLKNSSAVLLPIGSLIICTRATIGDCCINIKEVSTNQGFKNLIPENSNIDFLYYIISSHKTDLIRRASGSTFLEISKHDIEKLKYSVPSLSEQKAIADILSKADEEIDLLTSKLSALKSQKKGLMQKLLTGQIRVKVDSAAPLCERSETIQKRQVTE